MKITAKPEHPGDDGTVGEIIDRYIAEEVPRRLRLGKIAKITADDYRRQAPRYGLSSERENSLVRRRNRTAITSYALRTSMHTSVGSRAPGAHPWRITWSRRSQRRSASPGAPGFAPITLASARAQRRAAAQSHHYRRRARGAAEISTTRIALDRESERRHDVAQNRYSSSATDADWRRVDPRDAKQDAASHRQDDRVRNYSRACARF